MKRVPALLGTVARPALRALPAPLSRRLAGSRSRALSRAGGIGLRGRPVRIATGAGAGLRIDIGPEDPAQALGSYQLEAQAAIRALVHEGDVFYDIGAGIGFFTIIAARLAGPTGLVYAFEPDPARAALLRHNVNVNRLGNVLLTGRDAGSTTGFQEGVEPAPGIPGPGGMACPANPAVETVALNDFIDHPGVRPPDIVRVDVSNRLDALHGMTALLQHSVPTLLLTVPGDRADEPRTTSLASFLTEFGYELQPIGDTSGGNGGRAHLIARNERRTGLQRQREPHRAS
jgi:FkbM family methyltransferase